MPHGRLTGSALRGALLFPLLLSALPARADIYHSVSSGDTLASVARRYQITTETLRTVNGLSNTDDALPLGNMMLRIPGNGLPANQARKANTGGEVPVATIVAPGTQGVVPVPQYEAHASFGTSSYNPAPSRPASGNVGTLGKAMVETVRPTDTWETVADRYRAAGHDVTVESLRRRNNYASLPAAGGTVIVPPGQISVPVSRASEEPRSRNTPVVQPVAQTAPTSEGFFNAAPQGAGMGTSRALDGGVIASGEMELPFASENSTGTPVYQAPGSRTAPSRGGLPSRGGFGNLTRQGSPSGEIRILTPNEDASAPPAPRVRSAEAPTRSVARVAQVASSGARIRRLPDASAVTLYNCPVGTQLAILQEKTGWSAILMSDRSTGWVPTRYLRMTAQTVDVNTQPGQNAGPGGSVGNFARSNAGQSPAVTSALRWLGTPYRYGGTSRRGIDCSSLVQHAFSDTGYNLPRTAAQQATVGAAVDPSDLRSGDRLYFSASGSRIDHTGLYMGSGLFVHASGSGRQVMVSNLFEPRNWNIFVGARR